MHSIFHRYLVRVSLRIKDFFYLWEVSWMFFLLCFDNLGFHVQLVPATSPPQDWPPCCRHSEGEYLCDFATTPPPLRSAAH